MKLTVKIGLLLAILWIFIKLGFYFADYSDEGFKIGIFINILFVLVAAAIGLMAQKLKRDRTSSSNYFQDFKTALQGSLIYTIIISAFVYVYYTKIDPFVMQNRIDEKITLAEQQIKNPEEFQILKEQNPALKDKTAKEYVELVKKDAELLHSGFVQSTFTLIALMVASVFYSMLVALLFRKFIFRT